MSKLPNRLRAILVMAVLGATLYGRGDVAAATAPRSQRALALQRSWLLRATVQEAVARELEAASAFPERLRAKRLRVQPGDLLSATPRREGALRLDPGPPLKTKRARLGESFVPRGSDYDPVTGVLAIAAVSRVLLFEVETGALTVLLSPGDGLAFGFVDDVLFDGEGGLVIADRGAAIIGAEPTDGVIWRYVFAAVSTEQIGTKRPLSNPKLLARDRDGSIYVIDGEAGPQITPFFADRWDALYTLTGNKLLGVAPVWDQVGIQATAYDIDRSGRHWIANVSELITIKGSKLERPCPLPYPFQFLTGLVSLDPSTAMVLDGHASINGPKRFLHQVDRTCTATLLGAPPRLKQAHGLTRVPDDG